MPDELLFEAFFRNYQAYVRTLCAARCRSSGDAADAESIVWYDVYRAFERFQVDEPKARLYQLVAWRVRNLYRSGARKYEYEVEDQRLMRLLEGTRVAKPAIEQRLMLQQVLSLETPLDRELLFGRFVEELTWEELAMRHNLHRNTVSKRTEDTLRRVKAQFSLLDEYQEIQFD